MNLFFIRSERVYKCAIQGTILTEAKHINLSLHFLEQVIVYLGQDNVSHVPYRNSLLTSILRDSLGGNCLTTMLATLSVSTFNLEVYLTIHIYNFSKYLFQGCIAGTFASKSLIRSEFQYFVKKRIFKSSISLKMSIKFILHKNNSKK